MAKQKLTKDQKRQVEILAIFASRMKHIHAPNGAKLKIGGRL